MNRRELEFILQEGEGYKIEFKESLTALDKEMCAFANASGGFIYLGVDDNGRVKGVKITNKLKSQIMDIAANCDPGIKIILEEFENILIIEVREGTDKPYRCATGFYNRIGPNSQKLKRDEIIEFVQSEGKIRFDELIVRDFSENDFSEEKLSQFLRLAKISQVLDTPHILRSLHIAEIQRRQIFYLNSAVLFFARDLDHHYFHTAVTCALYKGIEKVDILDRKDFNRDLKYNVDETMLFLQRHLSIRYEFTGSPRRKEIPEIPFEALREAVLNAVIHRDYFEKGANIMVEIFADRLEITSPGGLPKGLKPEDFGKRSVLRNPNIANLFQRIEYIEKMGTGIRRIQKMMSDAGMPPVIYRWDNFVTAVFLLESKKESGKMSGKTSGKTSGKIIDIISDNPNITIPEISEMLGITERSVQRNMHNLQKDGKIKRIGSRKTGYWQIIREK